MIYATTPQEIAARRKAFIRKWRLKHRAVADSLEEAGDRLFTFARMPPSQWRSLRTTNAIERLHEEFKRRIKTQTVLPSADTAAMLFWALLASGSSRVSLAAGADRRGSNCERVRGGLARDRGGPVHGLEYRQRRKLCLRHSRYSLRKQCSPRGVGDQFPSGSQRRRDDRPSDDAGCHIHPNSRRIVGADNLRWRDADVAAAVNIHRTDHRLHRRRHPKGSDQIGLRGLTYNAVHSSFDTSSGTLSVSDGATTASLRFLGQYSQDNFHLADDGSGGTLVVAAAPPGQSGNASQVSELAAPDTFVFAPNFGQVSLADFAPATDTLHFSKSVFADLSALVAATRDDGSGNAVITEAAHDTITLQHVTTAQLLAHQSDFHIV